MTPAADILRLDGLSIDLRKPSAPVRRVVDKVGFSIGRGQIMALVGESGSGKTLIGRSILGLLPAGLGVAEGTIAFDGTDITAADAAQMRALRGARIGAVFQEPMISLNPSLTIGYQMAEALMLHRQIARDEAIERCIAMLERVKIAHPRECLASHPRQFSGGMRQRIMLASVMAMKPALLIADEPTTALDALIRKDVMELMVELTQEIGAAVLLVSHDLGMVAQYAQTVTVLRRGEMIEQGQTARVLLAPRETYTQALLAALPAQSAPAPAAERMRAPLVEVRDLCVDFARRGGSLLRRGSTVRAVDHLSLAIAKGEMLAVVGESGSGKSTMARALLRLCARSAGEIHFAGRDLSALSGTALQAFRTKTQMIFQDPSSSLDPRMTLGDTVAEGLRHLPGVDRRERQRRAVATLEEVGLGGDYAERYPHQLSGGQRQRVCIARAIVARPEFIVADEPVSALDVTIQSQVLDLLVSLQAKFGFTCLFISHDLAVVEQVADRVAVMFRGRLLEIGPRQAIYAAPRHPYTRRLLEATPRIRRGADDGFALVAVQTTAIAPPQGHAYFNDGSIPGEALSIGEAQLVAVGEGHLVCCARAGAGD